jgi:hypothetical protein
MSGEPIEEYLDALYVRSRSDPRRGRRLLEEAADHLRATAEELVATGMAREAAEAEAVRRFGPAEPLVRAEQSISLRALAVESLRAVTVLAGLGLVAVGLSGLVVAAMNAVFGRAFVGAGLPALVSGPGARAATVAENADDAVVLRVLAGLVGVLVLVVAAVVSRRRGHRAPTLPAWLLDVVAAVCFGLGAAGLGAISVDQAVQHGARGPGFFLSGALVALAGAAVFGVRAVRTLFVIPRS